MILSDDTVALVKIQIKIWSRLERKRATVREGECY